MKVYLYNKETKLYEGCREARLDVLETEKQGSPVYAKPINGTFVEPNEVNGMIARYNSEKDSWDIITSNVGMYVVNTKMNVISKVDTERPIRSYEIVISEEQYKKIKAEPDKYVVRDNELVDLSGTQEYQNKVNIKKYEQLILEAKEKYDAFLNTSVKYKGSNYLPRYLDDYEKLKLRQFPQEIWDAEGLTSVVMNKVDFNGLTSFLEKLVFVAYKEKKESIKKYKLAIKKLEGDK